MLKLIIYQFQYSKRQWLGTIPLLFVSSLIVGHLYLVLLVQ